VHFKSYDELEREFAEGKLHPKDLKVATAKKLNSILEPMRKSIKSKPEYDRLTKEIARSVTR
jgi:hypothetical protein